MTTMKRITDIDADYTCKKFSTALRRFMKQYPGHEEWEETFQWMYENEIDFFCDNLFADGTKNLDWSYALHLDVYEEHFYLALIERAA